MVARSKSGVELGSFPDDAAQDPGYNHEIATARLAVRGRPSKAADRVAESVASYILEQELKPGTALPNERVMTELLGVGRVTLREGLRLLESQGVISIRTGPGGGPIVREQRPDELANSLTLMLQFMRVPFSMVVDARAAVEPEIARLAALNRTSDQLTLLRALTDGLAAATNNPPEFRHLYQEFHQLLADATGNTVLSVIGATLRQVSATIHDLVVWGPRSVKAGVRTHERLMRAIEEQDGDAAYRETADQLNWYRSYFERSHPQLLAQQVRWVPTS